ncbi:hypothetical protein CV093_18615 [Oceanobacillus sp. 143]|uniref:Intracellular proteinase inhibitor BsuPI domain-containing protein n=1 Tax=Oceanobacillus zhaokaii TaxID=2052660 RepID=A0A345PKP6_9BACI|nr:BsuPI-related putative proteinase inhibitor [Oceanobacillus zhaokaii]AXI10576.1 hypothetical protein CUC15_17265 [Oceanobacillus zhaokaii]QGS69560.1 hypothetical protein CV093_18615 [Oceanobacillus sp. 143]
MKRSGVIALSLILILGLIGVTYLLVNQSNEQDNNEVQNEGDDPVNQPKVTADNGLTFELVEVEGNGKAFKYTVTNEGSKEIKLSFTTSQRYEYELRNITEGTTTKYSNGRAFMQVLGDTKLAPGKSVSYDISLPTLKPGEYQLTVYLVAKDMSEYVVSESFVIEE